MYSKFEKTIGYNYKNKKLLENALTHSSYAHENKVNSLLSNERLEFLGDAVLELVVSDYLFTKYPEMPEGELTKFRASIVCEPTLAQNARYIGIGEYLRLGKGEEITGGRTRDSLLADAFESIIGSIYLDGGIENAKTFILNNLQDDVSKLRNNFEFSDCKTYLQELIQKTSKEPLSYNIIDEKGPEHNKSFKSEVVHLGKVLGVGEGKSKKEAEQNAALDSLHKLLKN